MSRAARAGNRAVCSAFVAPDGLDEARARCIRRRRDVPHQRSGLERHAAVGEWTDDQQALVPLQIQSDPDGEVRVDLQRPIEVHAHG